MKMYITVVAILLTILPSSAWQYCSAKDKNVSCVSCLESGKQFKCPKQCGTPERKICNTVCSHNCNNSECEYDDQGKLICLHGCTNFYAGSYCQEYCMAHCVRCTQDGSQCLQCEQGRYGEICSQTCNYCNESDCDVNGTCLLGCTDGYYGPKCDKECDAKCTQCDVQTGACSKCIDGYYGVKCNRKCHSRCTNCDIATGECRQCLNGNNCTQKCQNCISKPCTAESRQCKDECEQGFKLQGKTCQIEETDDISTEYPSFRAEDYIWVFVVCSVIICIGSIIFLAVKCTRMKTNHKDEEMRDTKASPIESLYATVQKRCNVLAPSSSNINKMVANSNVDGLIYVDLDLSPPSMIDGEPFVSRKEEPTHYVDIDFTLTPGPHLPDKITEEGDDE